MKTEVYRIYRKIGESNPDFFTRVANEIRIMECHITLMTIDEEYVKPMFVEIQYHSHEKETRNV